jgi:uncharacterized membrane protein YccF (DUF307 family)
LEEEWDVWVGRLLRDGDKAPLNITWTVHPDLWPALLHYCTLKKAHEPIYSHTFPVSLNHLQTITKSYFPLNKTICKHEKRKNKINKLEN